MKLSTKLVIIGAGATAALCFSFLTVTTEGRGFNCRLCLAHKFQKTTYIGLGDWEGIAIWRHTGPVRAGKLTKVYDDYVAEPHEHQWCGGGWGTHVRGIWYGSRDRSGMHTYGPYPAFQWMLTWKALETVELLKDSDPKSRKEVFHAIIDISEPDQVETVFNTYEATKDATGSEAERAWREWLRRPHGSLSDSPSRPGSIL